jgi:hypothetical protein
MLAGLRRRKRSRRHPTPEQALVALEAGHCMYSPLSKWTGHPTSTGLRGDEDINSVLVCKAHYGRLRKLEPRAADKLERVLLEAFRSRG